MYYIDRKLVKQNAKAALKANYWSIVGWTVLGLAIIVACALVSRIPFLGIVGLAGTIFIVPVVSCGVNYYSYKVYKGDQAGSNELFAGFNSKLFIHVVGGYWWMTLFTFLWSLLFIIPGIVKSIAYSMTGYILIDQPEVSAKDALKLSMAMTQGHKGEIFVMYLCYIGWMILASITSGIVGVFYAYPYMFITMGGYYYELKALYEGRVPEEEAREYASPEYEPEGNLAYVHEEKDEVNEPEPEPEMAGLEFPDAPTWEGAASMEAPGEPCEYEADEYEPDENPGEEPEETDGD